MTFLYRCTGKTGNRNAAFTDILSILLLIPGQMNRGNNYVYIGCVANLQIGSMTDYLEV